MEWRAIDSVARDGTFFRGRDETGRVFVCRWFSREEISEWNGGSDPKEWDPGFYETDDSDEEVFPLFWQTP